MLVCEGRRGSEKEKKRKGRKERSEPEQLRERKALCGFQKGERK